MASRARQNTIATEESFLDRSTTKDMIYRIRDLNRKFRNACSQLILINNQIDETETRYNCSQAENRRSYRYILRLKLCTLEGVRNMFYEYAYAKADELEKMQLELYNKSGIAWNDTLAEESEDEEAENNAEDAEADCSSDDEMDTDEYEVDDE